MQVHVIEKVMKVNDELARDVRARLREAGCLALNVISAPGSGKTTLIEAAIAGLPKDVKVGVIEGDPDTALDAERIAAHDVPVVQIQTAGGCHLEANLVMRALDQLPLNDIDVLFIENVGNLVCPVEFDLGEDLRVAVVSTPEGHDKPAKYPKLFRTANVVVLNKVDLLPHVNFEFSKFRQYVHALQPKVPILDCSCTSGEGIDAWLLWLQEALKVRQRDLAKD
jgi:hydrogenase nickel incorporation protein HypB